MRGGAIFCNCFKAICPVQSHRKKNPVFTKPKSNLQTLHPGPKEGRIAIVTDEGRDAVDAAASGA